MEEALYDTLYDSQAMRGFTGIDLAVDAVPDETTILNFRHWLERHDLSRSLFDEVGALLEKRGLLMRRHDCRCHDQRRAVLDEEQREEPRPGDASEEEGQPVMEWMPPPDGIAMCQGGDVFASHKRREHPWKRLALSVSILQNGPSRRMAPLPTAALVSAKSFPEKRFSPSLPSSRAASSPWKPVGARTTGAGHPRPRA
jgi:hypothetical protein